MNGCSKEWRSRSGEMSGAPIFTLAKMNSAHLLSLLLIVALLLNFGSNFSECLLKSVIFCFLQLSVSPLVLFAHEKNSV